MLLKLLKIDTHCAVRFRNHLDRCENTEQRFYRQCVETIQEEPKLKLQVTPGSLTEQSHGTVVS